MRSMAEAPRQTPGRKRFTARFTAVDERRRAEIRAAFAFPVTKGGAATLQARTRHREVTDEGDCGDGSGCGNGRGKAGGAARAAGGSVTTIAFIGHLPVSSSCL